jgi:hypothetical protein
MRAAFVKPWNSIYRFDRAIRIVSLGADFLDPEAPGGLRYAREYVAIRRAAASNPSIEAPRLYVAESGPTITGGIAEHRFRMRDADIEGFAQNLPAVVMKNLQEQRAS